MGTSSAIAAGYPWVVRRLMCHDRLVELRPTDDRPPLNIDIVRLDAELPLPASAHSSDAGIDLRSTIDVTISPGGHRQLVPTGIAVAIPLGYAGFVLPRSGNALNHGIGVVNAPGLIDAGYRGEIKVVLLNTDPDAAFIVRRGDRVAQLVIQRVEQVAWNEVASLDSTERAGGFGHSGRT